MRTNVTKLRLLIPLAAMVVGTAGVPLSTLAQEPGMTAPVAAVASPLLPPLDDTKIALDTVWTLLAGFLVFFMAIGFAMVESGFCRAKNAANILAKNVIVFAAASVAFLAIGFGLMFGDGNGFWGYSAFSHWFLSGPDNSPYTGDNYRGIYASLNWAGVPLFAKFFFQLVFAATGATIVSGAVAERVRFPAFYVFGFVMAALIYPITGHWIWGGGWLAGYGMWDFAGSTVVHSVGGWAALTGAIMLGPRLGKYSPDGRINPIPGHSLTSATLGVFILWFGWFGFNPGSTMAADWKAIAHIATTTNTAAAAGAIAASLTARVLLGKPDLTMILNGALAGLVAITAPCAFVSVWPSSLIIGLVAGVLVVLSVLLFDRIWIDDPVGAVSVHLVCGIWGTLAVGLFAQEMIAPGTTGNGLLFGGGGSLLGAQAVGVLAVGAFTLLASFATWGTINGVIPLRVSPEEEMEGLDLGEHGLRAYPDFAMTGIAERAPATGSVRTPLAVTPRAVRTPPPAAPSRTGRGAAGGGSRAVRLVVENVDRSTLRAIWHELCNEPREKSPQDFKDLFPAVSAFRDASFIVRGDDPRRYQESLRNLLHMYGIESPQVRIESEGG